MDLVLISWKSHALITKRTSLHGRIIDSNAGKLYKFHMQRTFSCSKKMVNGDAFHSNYYSVSVFYQAAE